jgi:multicomponent Na+:H+ antiporter subunit G
MESPALLTSIIAHFFMVSGALIMFFGMLGMIILKDLFQRFHAATKCGVSGALCMLVGLSVWSGSIGFILKFAVILFFLIFTAPIIAHMLAISRLGEDAADAEEEE